MGGFLLNKKLVTTLVFFMLICLLVGVTSATDVNDADDGINYEINTQKDSTTNTLSTDDLNEMKKSETNSKNYTSNSRIEKTTNNALSVKRDENIGTFTQLTNLINDTQEGTVIELDRNYEYDGASIDGVYINKSITIDGLGHTLNGKDSGAIMDIYSGTIVLKNIIFTNARIDRGIDDDVGAAIFNDGNLTVINCTFTNNYASNLGGAIYSGGTLVIVDSTFTNNSATYAGAIRNFGGTLSISNSTFTENKAAIGGAVNNQKGDCYITNSTFTNNTALIGGAVYNASCINSVFTQNSASLGGGALADCDASNCTFINNSALVGGAMTRGSAIDCIFIDNTAEEGNDNYDTDFPGSFDELSDLINNTQEGGVVELDMNYVYYEGSVDGIIINKTITIDAKGHSLDGRRLSRIFTILDGNLTLNNITLVNGIDEEGYASAIYSQADNIITIANSTIKENTGYYIINIAGGFLNIEDSEVYDNTPEYVLITVYGDYKNITMNITNSRFDNSLNHMDTLDVISRDLNIINCTFEDKSFTLFEVSSLTIANSTFNGDKGIAYIIYSNGTFINNNVTDGRIVFNEGNFNVTDNTFNNTNIGCSISTVNFSNNEVVERKGGNTGALTIDNTNISITDSSFVNNVAEIYGGAIHFNQGNLNISNTVFDNNSAGTGGALMIMDYDSIKVENNTFKNNQATIGGAVYSLYEFDQNNTFINNSAKTENDVYQFTTKDSIDSLVFRSRSYTPLQINYTDEITDLPSYYNLNDEGLCTPVKNQGRSGACVSFGTLAALESSILKANNTTMDFSENNMKNLVHNYSIFGKYYNRVKQGGTYNDIIYYLTSWLGPVLESEDEFDENSTFSTRYDTMLPIQNVALIGGDDYNPDISLIKKSIIKYGALMIGLELNASSGNDYKQYTKYTRAPDHFVCIIGWDDDMEIPNAPDKGAWIVKNSYGTNWGYDGYFYLSYYDETYDNGVDVGSVLDLIDFRYYDAGAIIFNDTVRYDKNYQYELGLSTFFNNETNYSWYKNVFYSTEDENLAGISTYFEKPTDWQLYIYLNDELKLTQSGTNNPGYYTIKLDEYIPLQKDDKFEAVFKILTPDVGIPVSIKGDFIFGVYHENLSYISTDGENWQDLANMTWKTSIYRTINAQVACIKAFTTIPTTTNITVTTINDLINDTRINITLTENDTSIPIPDMPITITLQDDQTINTTTNNKGYIEIEIPVTQGENTITISTPETITHKNTTTTYTINAKKYDLTLNPITITGQTIDITATITLNDEASDINTGRVYFKINGKVLRDENTNRVIYADITNGVATLAHYTVPESWNNNTEIKAIYTKTDKIPQLTSNTVNPTTTTPETKEFTVEDVTTKAGEEVTITVTTKNIDTGKVVLKVNGKTVKANDGKLYTKVEGDSLTFTYTIPKTLLTGEYLIKAFYTSGTTKLEAESKLTIN